MWQKYPGRTSPWKTSFRQYKPTSRGKYCKFKYFVWQKNRNRNWRKGKKYTRQTRLLGSVVTHQTEHSWSNWIFFQVQLVFQSLSSVHRDGASNLFSRSILTENFSKSNLCSRAWVLSVGEGVHPSWNFSKSILTEISQVQLVLNSISSGGSDKAEIFLSPTGAPEPQFYWCYRALVEKFSKSNWCSSTEVHFCTEAGVWVKIFQSLNWHSRAEVYFLTQDVQLSQIPKFKLVLQSQSPHCWSRAWVNFHTRGAPTKSKSFKVQLVLQSLSDMCNPFSQEPHARFQVLQVSTFQQLVLQSRSPNWCSGAEVHFHTWGVISPHQAWNIVSPIGAPEPEPKFCNWGRGVCSQHPGTCHHSTTHPNVTLYFGMCKIKKNKICLH